MNRTVIKEMTQNRRSKFGHYVGEFATPGICHILASEDYDFVFFDMEHPGFSIETLKSAVRSYLRRRRRGCDGSDDKRCR